MKRKVKLVYTTRDKPRLTPEQVEQLKQAAADRRDDIYYAALAKRESFREFVRKVARR